MAKRRNSVHWKANEPSTSWLTKHKVNIEPWPCNACHIGECAWRGCGPALLRGCLNLRLIHYKTGAQFAQQTILMRQRTF